LNDFFLNFNRIVGQEIVENKIVNLSLKRLIIPGDVEGKHNPIVCEVFLKTLIRMSAAQFHLEILLILPEIINLLGVWGVNFQILLHLIDLEVVDWQIFFWAERLFHFGVEVSSEVIGVKNSEYPLIKIDIGGYVEVFPAEEVHDPQYFGDFLAVDENALSDSRVFDSRLSHVYRLVSQVIVHNAGSDSEVF